MRKLFSLFLSLVATTSLWAQRFQVGDLYYNITSGTTVEVTYQQLWSSSNYSGFTSVTIPSTVTYNGTTYSVTSIGVQAFYDCTSLTSVTIGNSVTSIGVQAFAYCRSLTSITIPNSVTRIGDLAFDGCTSLTTPVYNAHCFAYLPTSFEGTYTVPDGIKQIAGGAFQSCSSLTSIVIPNSVTSIGDGAFYRCSSLTSIVIPNSVTSIGNSAFSSCTSLTSITIPNSVTSIGDWAFNGCSSLTSVTIPNSVTSIGASAFYGCSSLTSIVIPESVTSIGASAFYGCSKLTSVTIPEGITSIEDDAFNGCSSLTSITIPNSVTSIGNYTFDGCYFTKDHFINNSSLDAEANNYWGATIVDSDVDGILIKDNVVIKGRPNITCVVIPNSVTSIGRSAFDGCSSLTSIIIPNSVTSIGDDAFERCSSLTSITIPNSVTSIGDDAFSHCSSLSSITIPNSVTSIGRSAFAHCTSLTSMFVEEGNTIYDSRNNCNAIIETASNTLIAGCQNTIIPNSVTSIGNFAFYNCSSLTSIIIPNSVTSIGEAAFYNCSSLTSIAIPNSVTSIGNSAFSNCSSLTSIAIPNSVTSIGNSAFQGCTFLTSIIIPNSVTSIGNFTFDGCSSLTSVTIGNSVTSIGYGAFHGCSSLTSITIPEGVTSIGENAFYHCDALVSITCEATTPPILGTDAFRYTKLSLVYIPDNTLSAYQQAWGAKYTYINNETILSLHVETSGTLEDLISDAGTHPSLVAKLILTGTLNDDDFTCMRETMTSLIDVDLSGITNTSGVNFDGKARLGRIILPTNLTSIGYRAFKGCSSLTSITIPESVTSIGEGAFQSCSSLSSVTIGNSVTRVGDLAFQGCNSLVSVILNSNDIVSKKYTYEESISDIFGSQVKEYVIGNSVTSIGDNAFRNCTSLTSIVIPDGVTSIGSWAFLDCTSLTSPVYNAHCFAYMPTSYSGAYTIPEGIEQIAGGAFYRCSSLTSITIPNSVTSIGDYAFNGCSLKSIIIPENITNIGTGVFISCASLTSVVWNAKNCVDFFTGSFSEIGTFSTLFFERSSMPSDNGPIVSTTVCPITSVVFGDEVESIPANLCYGLERLTFITLPNSVTSIGDDAFAYCSSLISITCEAMTPPTLGSSVFYRVSTSIPVYVPCGSENVYKAASGWKEFTNIQEPQVEYAIQVSTSNSQMGSAIVVYNTSCGAQISATANYGYHFVQWSDGNTDNPRTLTLTQDTVLTAEFALTIAGQCGDNLYWSYDETAKTISITGSGEMYDYTASTQPWLLFKEQIVEVTTNNTVTSIGTSAFEGCIRLGKVSLGAAMENVAANAFAECKRLYDIYCYASYPPFAEESSFANYNVYLYIPCENQRDYILDVVWGEFKFIECIGAEPENMGGDSVVINTGSTDVTIIWPTEENADTYSIVIKKDGKVVCTLTFNSEGQLLNIAFAPGREGNHPAQYAEAVANGKGFRFTVTGLEEGTHYTYNIDVKNTANQTINLHTGAFTTQSTTAVDNITTTTANIQKIMRDGQLIILRDGVEYNAMGQEL